MSILDKPTPTQLQGGLNKDYTFKPASYTTFVLNGIRDSNDGGKTQYQSEPGNTLVDSLPTNNTICGWIYGQNNEIYLFSADGTTSEIGIFKNGNYTTVVQAELGFSPQYPITGEYRLKNGCERIVYWCDGNNPDYFYNFDRPELFKDSLGAWDSNLFRLVPKVLPPMVDLVSVNDGGGRIPLGSLYFQVEILDDTLNTIYKTDVTPQVPIIDDSYGDNYTDVDGGLNIDQYTDEIGGVPITSKSVTLRFYNLDTSFAYLRVNVVRQFAGTQVIDAHAVSSLIPIGSEDFNWTYTGYNTSAGDYPLDYTEIITGNVRYDTAYVMEQVQGRLVRAALKQDSRDYSTYQMYASQLKVHWYCEEIEHSNAANIGDPKNPHTYWLKTSLQGDEVLALGVRYLHTDGVWSPVFHIPGRPPVVSDETNMFVVDNTASNSSSLVWESDVEHFDESDFDFWNGTYVGSQIRKWKVFNTAAVTNTISGSHPYILEGTMGYYEGTSTYPDIRDCNNNLIWGTDYNGDDITTLTAIRHHRVPDRSLIPIVSGTYGEYIRPIGLKFYNISYPSSDIVGHQFMYVIRDDANKTVIDSGWFGKVADNDDLSFTTDDSSTVYGISAGAIYTTSYVAGDPNQLTGLYGQYCSANVLFNSKIFVPTYMKFNRSYETGFKGGIFDPTSTLPVGAEVDRSGGGSIGISIYHINVDALSDVPQRTNYKVDNQVFVGEGGFITASGYDVAVENIDYFSPTNIVKTTYELEDYETTLGSGTWIPYVYKKTNVKPYESLFNLNYKYLNFNYQTSLDPNDNIYYNGDTIISLSAPTKMLTGDPDNGVYLYGFYKYMLFFEEHDLNASLRHAGTLDSTTYYRGDGKYETVLGKIAALQDDGTYDPYNNKSIIPEYYAYNKDFNKQSTDSIKVPLPITYNYCSDCIGEYNTRIIFSPKSFDEETFDLYRINKINDYIDLPGYRGQITGLKYKNNVLLTHCKEGTFMLQPNPQSISTNLADIYLSTGDFLGIPPAELMQTDVGYAGCQSKQHQCDTPYGWCWVDQLRTRIFKFDGKLEELSNKGLMQWFNDHLPSELNAAFYEIFHIEYPDLSTLSIENNGIGIIMYYDPKYSRLFITKKDYYPINFTDRAVFIGDLTYDINNGVWTGVNVHGETVTVTFDDIEWFENKSWTLSYSFDYENIPNISPWTSWHSYIPPFAFWDNYYFYTMPANGSDVKDVYRHDHENNYQTFYGTKSDFIIEWMDYGPETRDFNAVHYNGYTLRWDSTHKQWVQNNDITFNRGMFYTFNQSTGLVNLQLVNQHTNPYANIGSSNTTKYVIRTDNNFKISGIYDIATDVPVVTSEWDSTKNDYYIDLVQNLNAVDSDKSIYEVGNIRDKFIISRLYFNPEEDYKKVVALIQNHDSISIR